MTAGKLTTDTAASFPKPNLAPVALAWGRAVMQRIAQLEDDQTQLGVKALEANKTLIQTLRRATGGANPLIYTDTGIVIPAQFGWLLAQVNPDNGAQTTQLAFLESGIDLDSTQGLPDGSTAQQHSTFNAQNVWLALGKANQVYSSLFYGELDANDRPRVYIGSSGLDAIDQHYVENQSAIATGYSDDGTQWVRILGKYFAGATGGLSTEPTAADKGTSSGSVGGAAGGAGWNWRGSLASIASVQKTITNYEWFSRGDFQTGYGYQGPALNGQDSFDSDDTPPLGEPMTVVPGATSSTGAQAAEYVFAFGHDRSAGVPDPNGLSLGMTSGTIAGKSGQVYWKASGVRAGIHLFTQVGNGQPAQVTGGDSAGSGWHQLSQGADPLDPQPVNIGVYFQQDDYNHPVSTEGLWIAMTAGSIKTTYAARAMSKGDVVEDGTDLWLCLQDTDTEPAEGTYWARLAVWTDDALRTLADDFQGAWNNQATYKRGNVVTAAGALYVALKQTGGLDGNGGTIPAVAPDQDSDGTHWELILAAGSGGGTTLPPANTVGDVLTWDGTEYEPAPIPDQLPASANAADVLTWDAVNGVWAAEPVPAPAAADDTTAGIVRLATDQEASDGTDTSTAMTPAEVKAAVAAGAYTLLVGWKGTYDAGTTYNPGDLVRFNGALVLALDISTGSTPPVALPDTADWALIVAKPPTSSGSGGGNGPLVVGPTNSLTMPGLWLQTDNDGNFIQWLYDDHNGVGGSNTNGAVSFGPTNGLQQAGLWIQTDENLVPQMLVYDDGNH